MNEPNQHQNRQTRREFLGKTGRGAAAVGLGLAMADNLLIQPVHAGGTAGAGRGLQNDKIVIGLIGCGGQGIGVMRDAMGNGCEVAAVCDVDEEHRNRAAGEVEKRGGKRPETIKDYRKLLERKDINAVIIGTPDHWHALNLIHACEANKDIYCEKPISHNIVEAKAMDAAARRFGRIVQVGTWQRSAREFTSAVDYIRAGKLGKVTTVRAWKTDSFRMGRNKPGAAPPANLDYDFWLGPARQVPYIPNYVHFNDEVYAPPLAAWEPVIGESGKASFG